MSFIGGRPAGYLSPGEIYALAVKHGFQPGQEAATATAIAQQESSGIVNSFNPNDPHGGSVGLMQINGANAHLIGGDNWKTAGMDPDASMEAAHALYANRGNFNDWGGYTDGGYKKYYSQALDAANAGSGGTTLTSHPFTPPHTLTPPTAGPQYTPEAVAAANSPPPAPPQNFFQKMMARPAPTKDKDGNPVQGKSPLEKIASSFDKSPGEAPQPPPPQQFGPVQDPMAQMAGPAAQLFASVQAAAAKPLSWTSAPYGSGAGQQMGTTLNTAGYYGG